MSEDPVWSQGVISALRARKRIKQDGREKEEQGQMASGNRGTINRALRGGDKMKLNSLT